MKLHIKLSLALLSGLIVVVAVAQFLQYVKMTELISSLSDLNLSTIKGREEGFARNIFNSVDRAVAGSLERGEMEKFTNLIADQKNVEGVPEFSLYDKEGVVSHSSDPSSVKKLLSDDIRERLLSNSEELFRHVSATRLKSIALR